MWGAVVSAGSNLVSAGIGSSSAKNAAGEQAAAIDRAVGAQQRQFDLTRQDLRPQRELGFAATGQLRAEMGLGQDPMSIVLPNGQTVREAAIALYNATRTAGNAPFEAQGGLDQQTLLERLAPQVMQQAGIEPQSVGQGSGFLTRRFSTEDLENDPIMQKSFQFGLSEGEKAVRRMFGAKGLARSGAAVKALTRYATDYTNTKGGDAYNRFTLDQNNLYSRLTGAAGIGSQAQQTIASAGQRTADNIADLSVGAGNARGAAAIAQGNALSGAITGVGNTVADYLERQNRITPSWSTPPISNSGRYFAFGEGS